MGMMTSSLTSGARWLSCLQLHACCGGLPGPDTALQTMCRAAHVWSIPAQQVLREEGNPASLDACAHGLGRALTKPDSRILSRICLPQIAKHTARTQNLSYTQRKRKERNNMPWCA